MKIEINEAAMRQMGLDVVTRLAGQAQSQLDALAITHKGKDLSEILPAVRQAFHAHSIDVPEVKVTEFAKAIRDGRPMKVAGSL